LAYFLLKLKQPLKAMILGGCPKNKTLEEDGSARFQKKAKSVFLLFERIDFDIHMMRGRPEEDGLAFFMR